MVRLADTGNLVVCGDAIYTQDNLDHDAWGGQADPVAAKESGAKLQRIAQEENALLLFGHDPMQAQQMHRSPQSYR
jgi:glyoxylase-like metal-dependent hydrolase (beta-lactamase superfamily II)